MARYLLVTNDFLPKVGGIQNYLFELWSRLDPDSFLVLTTSYLGDDEFDSKVDFKVVRRRGPFLPTPSLLKEIRSLVRTYRIEMVLLDPIFPVGVLGPYLGVPYGLILHGAEVAIPARLPLLRPLLAKTVSKARLIISAGSYPDACARGLVESCGDMSSVMFAKIMPGVDGQKFRPAEIGEVVETRNKYGLSHGSAVLFVSRLVPRKGADVLIRALAKVEHVSPQLWVVGSGRDEQRLRRLASKCGVDAVFLGRMADEDLVKLHRSADLFAMLCRNRWFGLEQEGFGIVFVEAQASGVPVLVGRSGGSPEALLDRRTGILIDSPGDVISVARSLETLLRDDALRSEMAQQARSWVVGSFDHNSLALQLQEVIDDALDSLKQANITSVGCAAGRRRKVWRQKWIAQRRR